MSVKGALPSGVVIRPETAEDKAAIDHVIAAAFGDGRFSRSVRHLRRASHDASLSFVTTLHDEVTGHNKVIGSIRYWPILVGGRTQLLLGPLAVLPEHRGKGFGKALVAHSLSVAETTSYDFILISGEPDYFPRFGFEPARQELFLWPGFIEPERLQIKWLSEDAKTKAPASAQAILPIL